jgi:glycosyltransferase involved in cell wall biosynthesis
MLTRGVVPIRPGCGGAELVAYQLSRYLAARHNRVTLVADTAEETRAAAPKMEFVPIDSALLERIRHGRAGFCRWILQHLVGNLAATRVALRLIRRRDYDLVHCHGNLSAYLVSRLSRVPVVYTEHDATPWQCRYRHWWERLIRRAIYRRLNGAAFRNVHLVLATFDGLRDEIVSRWKVDPSRVVSISNGVDLETFDRMRRRARWVQRMSGRSVLPPKQRRHGFERYCLFVGQLTSRKAPDLVLRALVKCEDVCCVFVGDGPMRLRLERLAEDLGVSERVAFLGQIDSSELADIYADADLLVLPSVSEASPLVVAEAMAWGTPVLATRISGVPSLVKDWETGFLVTPADVGELAIAMRFLMRDEALRSEMAERASERVRKDLGWSSVAETHVGEYLTLIGADQPAPQAAPAEARLPQPEEVAA